MGTIKNKDYIRLQTCSNCWICEGWTEYQFEFKPPEWVDYEVVPVKLHLSIDNYQGQIIEINEELSIKETDKYLQEQQQIEEDNRKKKLQQMMLMHSAKQDED